MGFSLGLFYSEDSGLILKEAKLSKSEKERYLKFLIEFDKYIYELLGSKRNRNCYNDPNDVDAITEEETSYLKEINRGKVNPGVVKLFVKIKKQRKLIEKIK